MDEVVKILVADDSQEVREQMLGLLVKLGHTDITFAKNGKSAIDKIINEIDKYLPFDLIIIDQNTSVLDGMEVHIMEGLDKLSTNRTGIGFGYNLK
jgi:CheY-like chemotaxis protein